MCRHITAMASRRPGDLLVVGTASGPFAFDPSAVSPALVERLPAPRHWPVASVVWNSRTGAPSDFHSSHSPVLCF